MMFHIVLTRQRACLRRYIEPVPLPIICLPCAVSQCVSISHKLSFWRLFWNFLRGWFSVMGLILVAPNEIFNLSVALVSDNVSYKDANLEWSTTSVLASHCICQSLTGDGQCCIFYWFKIIDPILLLPVKRVEVDTNSGLRPAWPSVLWEILYKWSYHRLLDFTLRVM